MSHKDELIRWRRYFHQLPELGFQEYQTAQVVANELRQLGLIVKEQVGKTGVTGLLEGEKPGKRILVRLDMDALPIQEQNMAEYTSIHPGVMHACGHDAHLAIGLISAGILSEIRSELTGSILFVFQPAEEGLGGAAAMIADGLLELHPDYCLAVHVWNNLPLGTVAIRPGPFMASSDQVEIIIQGKGGHGAMPDLAADPILAGAAIITNLQSIVSRNISPLEPAVVSITQFHGGDAFNVIPSQVVLQGSIRTYLPETRVKIIRRVNEISETTSHAMGCTAEVNITPLTGAVINDPQLAAVVSNVCRRVLPGSRIDTAYQTMASDDMAEFMAEIPGCYFMMGSANDEKGLNFPHHHPQFDFDEQAMVDGCNLLVDVLKELLK